MKYLQLISLIIDLFFSLKCNKQTIIDPQTQSDIVDFQTQSCSLISSSNLSKLPVLSPIRIEQTQETCSYDDDVCLTLIQPNGQQFSTGCANSTQLQQSFQQTHSSCSKNYKLEQSMCNSNYCNPIQTNCYQEQAVSDDMVSNIIQFYKQSNTSCSLVSSVKGDQMDSLRKNPKLHEVNCSKNSLCISQKNTSAWQNDCEDVLSLNPNDRQYSDSICTIEQDIISCEGSLCNSNILYFKGDPYSVTNNKWQLKLIILIFVFSSIMITICQFLPKKNDKFNLCDCFMTLIVWIILAIPMAIQQIGQGTQNLFKKSIKSKEQIQNDPDYEKNENSQSALNDTIDIK